jgi:hypothetical protein
MSVPMHILILYLCILSNFLGGNEDKNEKICSYKSYINFWKLFFYLQPNSFKKGIILMDHWSVFWMKVTLQTCARKKLPLAPMGVLAPGSAHARPSAQPPFDTGGNFPPHVSVGSADTSPSNLQTSPPTLQTSYPKFRNPRTNIW